MSASVRSVRTISLGLPLLAGFSVLSCAPVVERGSPVPPGRALAVESAETGTAAPPPRPAPSEALAATEATSPQPAARPEASAPLALPRLERPAVRRATLSGVVFEGVAFDARDHRLVVADQPGGPGSRWTGAAAAAREAGALAAVNGGFFTPEGAPLGLVVSRGSAAGSWNGASSLGGGLWLEDDAGEMKIARREALGAPAARRSRELLQTGPMLVEDGRPVSGLESSRASARVLLLWDGGSRWWVGRAAPCSLAALASALAAGEGPAGWPVRHALNLDGGRSSDLWVSGRVTGGPLERRGLLAREVRNFLLLLPR